MVKSLRAYWFFVSSSIVGRSLLPPIVIWPCEYDLSIDERARKRQREKTICVYFACIVRASSFCCRLSMNDLINKKIQPIYFRFNSQYRLRFADVKLKKKTCSCFTVWVWNFANSKLYLNAKREKKREKHTTPQ